jgi:DNA methylase
VNLGDKRIDGGLLNVPGRFCTAMLASGFVLKDHIIWAKAMADVDGIINGRVRIEPCADRLNDSGWEPVFRFVKAGADAWTDTVAIQAIRRNTPLQRYLPEDLMTTVSSLNGRNLPNVWLISGRNIQEDHYGCFPPELVERLVAFACPPFVNPDGSLPRRLVDMEEYDDGIGRRTYGRFYDRAGYRNDGGTQYTPRRPVHIGWTELSPDATPGIVFDPFAGPATTGEVALKMRRSFIGCELYPQHVETAARRCTEALEFVRQHYGYTKLADMILNPAPAQDDDGVDNSNVIPFDEERIKAMTAKLRASNDRLAAVVAVGMRNLRAVDEMKRK